MTPDYKLLSRGYSRDMSPEAISKRLDKVAELYALWTFLRTGKRVDRPREGQAPLGRPASRWRRRPTRISYGPVAAFARTRAGSAGFARSGERGSQCVTPFPAS